MRYLARYTPAIITGKQGVIPVQPSWACLETLRVCVQKRSVGKKYVEITYALTRGTHHGQHSVFDGYYHFGVRAGLDFNWRRRYDHTGCPYRHTGAATACAGMVSAGWIWCRPDLGERQ